MENSFFKFFKLDSIIEHIKGYVETRIQLFKIEVAEKAARILTSLFFVILLSFSFLMLIIFTSLALGNYLNTLFQNSYMGFAILALFYFIMVIILAISVTRGVFHRMLLNVILGIFTGITNTKRSNKIN